jgi:hypothetical protein
MAQAHLWRPPRDRLRWKKSSIVAWLAQNYHNAEAVISVGAFIVIMGLTVGLLWVNRLAPTYRTTGA